MTNLAHRTIGDYGALGNRELELLRGDECPDCRSKDLAPGPRGNVGQNIFCSTCGAEFNIVYPRYVIWGQRIRSGRHPGRRRA
jgi:DNA-directed RNA polymerase subunit RPC12/RpoP